MAAEASAPHPNRHLLEGLWLLVCGAFALFLCDVRRQFENEDFHTLSSAAQLMFVEQKFGVLQVSSTVTGLCCGI